MKLLLDEQLPHALRHQIQGHEVVTVVFAGFGGLKNGTLLRVAAEHGFEAMITNDHGIEYQQNLSKLPIAVIALQTAANDLAAIIPFLPALHRALATLRPRALVHVDAGD